MRAAQLVVRTVGELMITSGGLVLLFLVWQLVWTDVVADRSQARTTDALVEQWDADAQAAPLEPLGDDPTLVAPGDEASTPLAEPVLAALPSAALAVLHVPEFGNDYAVPVLEGTTAEVLKEGIGRYTGSADAGEVGNFALAGHRTTYGAPFNPIAELDLGDPVVVETADAYYVYTVVDTLIVDPNEVSVIAPVPGRPGETPTEAYLTMTSCHPMYSARQRYIVHAVLESTSARAEGPPAALTP
ncbi:class E sortase [Aquipuribacter hungaricus]|uniref:Class E sortase n=1 Tax=Aquipuribacter hungaricus TaxID=545624 RepID=A0ABV7WH76_9MICO